MCVCVCVRVRVRMDGGGWVGGWVCVCVHVLLVATYFIVHCLNGKIFYFFGIVCEDFLLSICG